MKEGKSIQDWERELPPAPKPVGNYEAVVQAGDLIYTSGMIPLVEGELRFKGKVGRELTVEDGYEAARVCTLNGLSAVLSYLGTLERVKRVVQVVGYVASAEGFTDQPKVLNGATDLLVDIFGDRGKPSRLAVGVNELPLDAAVELSLILRV